MKRLPIALCAALTLLSTQAHAECYTADKAPLDASCVVMQWGEQRGVWIRDTLALELRQAQAERDELRDQTTLLTQLADTRQSQVVLLRSAVGDYQDAIGELETSNAELVASNQRLAKQAASARAWWRHPALWFAAGVVVTGGVVTVVAVR